MNKSSLCAYKKVATQREVPPNKNRLIIKAMFNISHNIINLSHRTDRESSVRAKRKMSNDDHKIAKCNREEKCEFIRVQVYKIF